jgi:hypothetical protein
MDSAAERQSPQPKTSRSHYQNNPSIFHACRKSQELVSREGNQRDRRCVRQVHAIRQMGPVRIVHRHQLGIGRVG